MREEITRIILAAQVELEDNTEDWDTDRVKAEAFDKIRDLLIGDKMVSKIHEKRVDKILALLKAIAGMKLSMSEDVDYNITFTSGIAPVLVLVPPKFNEVTHKDFKQLMAACENEELKFSYNPEKGNFKFS